jgi:hypothetical protein
VEKSIDPWTHTTPILTQRDTSNIHTDTDTQRHPKVTEMTLLMDCHELERRDKCVCVCVFLLVAISNHRRWLRGEDDCFFFGGETPISWLVSAVQFCSVRRWGKCQNGMTLGNDILVKTNPPKHTDCIETPIQNTNTTNAQTLNYS